MRPPRLHLPRPGRRPRVPNVEQRPVSGEYAGPLAPACGAEPEGQDAPPETPDATVGTCRLPSGHGGSWHMADATINGVHHPSGWAWPRRS